MIHPVSSSPESLAGKVAVVSGACSGIGAAIAKELSSRGAHVVINYPFASLAEEANIVLRDLPGNAESIAIEADLATIAGPTKLIATTVAEYGRVDILVNNAGVSALLAIDEEDDKEVARVWDAVVSVNGRGTLLLTRAALKHLSSTHSRIINICSTTSRNPDPDMSIYAGSKGMIESFTRCWARDLPRKYGCTVNAVAPGPVTTKQMLSAPAHFRELLGAGLERVPAGARMATPEEIAWTVAMLCEEKADWLNGLYIPVCGGATLC